MLFTISKFNADEKLFAIHINKNIYTGGSSTLLKDVTNNKILYKHSKSITHITSTDLYLASSSYDCTVSVFKNNNELILEDVVEGPDTEIKCVAFDSTNQWLALATRGKSVWLCRINSFIEIDKILEDHSEDVKGCTFYADMLFTYGYDESIKVYQYFEVDESWEMVQSLEESGTVFGVVFIEDSMYSCNGNGEVSKYKLEKGWTLVKKKQISEVPILAISNFINNNGSYILCGVNLGNLVFLDEDLEIKEVLKVHDDFINCISWSQKEGLIGTCSDDKTYCLISSINNLDGEVESGKVESGKEESK